MKNWVLLLGKLFSKAERFPPKVEKWKSIFSGKRYQIDLLRTYLAVLRKEPEFSGTNLDKKCSDSKETFWGIKEKPGRCLPRLECTFEITLEKWSAKAQMFKLTVQKKPKSLVKRNKKSSALKKWKTEFFLKKIFSEFDRFPPELEKWHSIFSGKRCQIFFLPKYFAAFRNVPSFFAQSSTKYAQVPRKKLWITEKKQEHSSTPWMHY